MQSNNDTVNKNNGARNTCLYIAILIFGVMFGVGTYVMSGFITLLSLVFLIENNTWLKGIAYHFNKLFDIIIFAFGVWAKMNLGVTIGMAMLFAGLGYSMVYGPYIHATFKLK